MSEENLAPAAGQAESGAVEQEMNNLMQQRMLKVRELREAGIEPFGRALSRSADDWRRPRHGRTG